MHALFALLEREKPFIDREIARVLPKKPTRAWARAWCGRAAYAHDVAALQAALARPVWALLSRGGKRWRPALLLAAAQACGGRRGHALRLAPVPELIHNGTLIVDDIEDQSLTRRGQPAVHLLHGQDIAINAGNALYFLPLSIIERARFLSPAQRCTLYPRYARAMTHLSIGQAMDIHWHGTARVPSEKQYLQMCLYKTGALARLAAEMGAVCAGAPEKTVAALGAFGSALGVGFQIQDDVLNLAPRSKAWGKDAGEDITEGKKSLPVLYALSRAPKKEARTLLQTLRARTRSRARIQRAIAIIQKTGALERAAQTARAIVQKSWRALAARLKKGPGKDKLALFADFAVHREL